MKTKFLSTLVLLLVCIAANAYDVEIDSVYYNLNLSDLTATVASPSKDGVNVYYKGKVSVPSSITFRGRTFTVVGVAQGAFEYSDSLTSVSLPSTIKELPSNLFYRCTLLSDVNLPDSITEIPSYCFADCKLLEKVTIPESVTVIEGGAFDGCSSFGPEFVVRPNMTYLGHLSFSDCPKLKRFIIEDSDDYLGPGLGISWPLSGATLDYLYVGRPLMFNTHADTIKVLELGHGLKSNEFPTSYDFTRVISNIEDPTLFDPEFSNNTYLNAILYVPAGKLDAYRQAKGWKNFFDIRESKGITDNINEVATAKKAAVTRYYNLSGQIVAKGTKGVVIVRNSDGTAKKIRNK